MTWVRATVAMYCGYCGHPIAFGEPMREFAATKKRRCVTCAGEPVPVDLPALPERPRKIQPSQPDGPRFTRTNVLAHDWKIKQSGADR